MRYAWIAMVCVQATSGWVMGADYIAGRPADGYVWLWAGCGVLLGILNSLEFAFERKAGAR